MSPRRPNFPWPGPGRITVVVLAVVPALMAYPWSSTRDRWVLGVAIAVLIVLLGCWRGLYFTTILRRRAAMPRRHRGVHTNRKAGPDVRATALLRVVPSAAGPVALPMPLIADYLDRYGIRADTVRVTSRDARSEEDVPQRETWIGLTLSAAANLAALQARSPRIPLQETAAVAARRLADHLREIGWEITGAETDDVPELFSATAREGWRAVSDGNAGYVAAYRVCVDHALPDTLAQVRDFSAAEIWTAVEIAGTADHCTLASACALRTEQRPAGAGPLPGLIPQHGIHRPALQALDPLSEQRLDGHVDVQTDDIAALHWPTEPDTPEVPRSHARHAAANRT
jgi:type VII secretion protein EccE